MNETLSHRNSMHNTSMQQQQQVNNVGGMYAQQPSPAAAAAATAGTTTTTKSKSNRANSKANNATAGNTKSKKTQNARSTTASNSNVHSNGITTATATARGKTGRSNKKSSSNTPKMLARGNNQEAKVANNACPSSTSISTGSSTPTSNTAMLMSSQRPALPPQMETTTKDTMLLDVQVTDKSSSSSMSMMSESLGPTVSATIGSTDPGNLPQEEEDEDDALADFSDFPELDFDDDLNDPISKVNKENSGLLNAKKRGIAEL
jgi:hypothetical protein